MFVERIQGFQNKNPKTFALSLLNGMFKSRYELMMLDPTSKYELIAFNHVFVALKTVQMYVLLGECEQSADFLIDVYKKILYDDKKNTDIGSFIEHFNMYIKFYIESQSNIEVFIINLMFLSDTAGMSFPVLCGFLYIYLSSNSTLIPDATPYVDDKHIEELFQTIATNLSGSEELMGEKLAAKLDELFTEDRDRYIYKKMLDNGAKLAHPYVILLFQYLGKEKGRMRGAVMSKAVGELNYSYGDMITTVEKVMSAEKTLKRIVEASKTPFHAREEGHDAFTFDSIECAEVACNIADTNIFENFNAKFNADSITILKGASGCGKSTLLSTISQRFYDGDVKLGGGLTLRGRDGAEFTLSTKEAVNIIRANSFSYFGNGGLFTHGSIRENFKMYMKEDDDEKLKSVLRKVGLRSISLDKLAYQLSLGQQQRVLISFMLASKKQLYFMDEVLCHLNETTAHQCAAEIIRHVQDQKACLIVVDHSCVFEGLDVPKTVKTFHGSQ